MAFLLPDNIPSHSGVPARLREVARALKRFAPEEVTVWLRETDDGVQYLVLLDPGSGIMVIDAPRLLRRKRSRRSRGRVFDSFEMLRIPEEIEKQAGELRRSLDGQPIRDLPVKCAIVVPDRDRDELSDSLLSEADRGLPVLCRDDLQANRIEYALRNVFGGDGLPSLSEREQNHARSVINPEVILARQRVEALPLFKDPEIAPEDVIRVMNRQQERAAEHLGFGYRVLRGVAGSGKTLILVHRARHLRKLWPQCRILMLCYNRLLARALEAELETDEDDDSLVATNIDRLAYRLSKKTHPKTHSKEETENRSHRLQSDFGQPPDFDQNIVNAMETAKRLPDSQRYDVVLVDEAQDFDHARLNLAHTMLKADRLRPDPQRPDRDNFVIALDAAQNVYRRSGVRWNPPGVDAQGRARTARGRSTLFRKNYRNTREILEFAMNFLAGSREWKDALVDLNDQAALIPPESARRTGTPPSLKTCRDLRGEAERITSRVAELLAEGRAPSDMIVMYGCLDLLDELRREFSRQGLPYFHVHGKYDKNSGDPRDQAVHVRDKVLLSTLSSVKGLEFAQVFIGGVNQIRVRDVHEQDQLKAAKSHLYVAMTRATDELHITMSGGGEIGSALRAA